MATLTPTKIHIKNYIDKYENLGDILYPVGSIYMTTSSVSPAAIYGGTWEKIIDRFLLGAGEDRSAGSSTDLSRQLLPDETGGSKHIGVVDSFTRDYNSGTVTNYIGLVENRAIWADSTSDINHYYSWFTAGGAEQTTYGDSFPNRNRGEYKAIADTDTGKFLENSYPQWYSVYIWRRVA